LLVSSKSMIAHIKLFDRTNNADKKLVGDEVHSGPFGDCVAYSTRKRKERTKENLNRLFPCFMFARARNERIKASRDIS
jgi:hypothetical protein